VYFLDLSAGMLIFLALPALFMVKGKHGPAKPKSIVANELRCRHTRFFLVFNLIHKGLIGKKC
jgi:hypothetical protein